MKLLPHLLRRFVNVGRLNLHTHDGAHHTFGARQDGPTVSIRLADTKVERELFFNPELATAEAYMDGRLIFENGSTVYDLLLLFSVNRQGLASHPLQQALRKIWRAMRGRHQANPVRRAAQNARKHYDLPKEFYALFLDESLSYSCAYFTEPNQSLADAQRNKLRHIVAKLNLAPGMTVAEIGSGWGALAIYLAKTCSVNVTAINVSPQQLNESRSRAEAAGVAGLVDFRELDYRDLNGKFDRVVSVGMMEHVGVAYFDEYFNTVQSLLKPGGFAMIHAIGRMSPPGSTAPFIRKYIFPGGYVPAMSEVFASTERTKLWVSDCEVLRLHYYYTIKQWRQRFDSHRADAVTMMGERFVRMWEFYLAAVELGFLNGSNMVYQLLLSQRRDDVPIVRDYIVDSERKLTSA